MPIALHQILWIGSLVVGFFVVGYGSFANRDSLLAAGVPGMVVTASPLVWLVAVTFCFALVPSRCPGCGWPVAFWGLSRKMIYRCLACGHVHCTIWGPKKSHAADSVRFRVPLRRFALADTQTQRTTLSGDHFTYGSSLIVSLRPAPRRGRESERHCRITAVAADDRGKTFARVDGTIDDWNGEHVLHFWHTELALRHRDWKDIRLDPADIVTVDVSVNEAGPECQSLLIRPVLEFRRGP